MARDAAERKAFTIKETYMEIQLWREILNPYELAVKEVTTKFKHLIKEHKDRGIYCPIERVEGRVKTIASILDK